jgi:glutamine cyclotransferase
MRTGAVVKRVPLESMFFGEGVTVLNDLAYMLTWLNQRGFVYDPVSLRRIREFRYAGEGWGITNDGTHLITSNGSSILTVIDPETSSIVRSIPVTMQGSLVGQLNELEWVEGEIWANVWQTMRILRINPATGAVVGVIDCTGIVAANDLTATMDVFNGIAYDPQSKAIFVTGKNWPKIYQIELE